MKIYTSFPESLPPTALTIGFFDGMHLGHRALLNCLKQTGAASTVLTFLHHPLKTLKPTLPYPQVLTPWPLKLALMEQMAIDHVILLPFTRELASLSFEDLLSQFDLNHLILGEGSAFGKDREGNEKNIQAFAEKKQFKARFIPKSMLGGDPISSSAVRKAIVSGQLGLASQLLGRPHAIYVPPNETEISIKELCLPPDGVYEMRSGDLKVEMEIRSERILLANPFPTQTLLSFDPEVTHV